MASRLASPLLRIHSTVASAVAERRPIVALESTIITHGLPFPANIETAFAIEQAVRDHGAVPATTAFLDGIAYVGLEKSQLQRLAEVGLKATKTSRRDVTSVLAAGKGSVGATTVSGTMILAHMAGISIFGTGGIGGVHRGGQNSMDVSADLTELSRTPVAVFCSGAKSILDIPRTLEYLETFGVSTHTFNSNGQFPAFYSAQSGCKVPITSTHRDAAQLIHSNILFNMQSGMIFGVPIPSEFEAAGEKIQAFVEQAVQEAKEAGMDRRGKEVTPWLLKRVGELSQGQSITSNKALVINNVSTAAKVACELEEMRKVSAMREGEKGSKSYFGTDDSDSPIKSSTATDVKFIGSTVVDITSQPSVVSLSQVATTWPGRNTLSLGGVARNMAESAHRILAGNLTASVKLISPVGQDVLGQYVRLGLSKLGLRTDGLMTTSGSTPSVTLQLDNSGDLITGIADIDANGLVPEQASLLTSSTSDDPGVLAFDANISVEMMEVLLQHPHVVTLFEPTSVIKCTKIIDIAASPDIMTPNEAELMAMYRHAILKRLLVDRLPTAKEETISLELSITIEVVKAAMDICLWKGTELLIKSGERGVLLARLMDGGVVLQRYPAHKISKEVIANTTGCGDTFAGAVAACVHVKLRSGDDGATQSKPSIWSNDTWAIIIQIAQQAATLTLQSTKATSTELHTLSAQMELLTDSIADEVL